MTSILGFFFEATELPGTSALLAYFLLRFQLEIRFLSLTYPLQRTDSMEGGTRQIFFKKKKLWGRISEHQPSVELLGFLARMLMSSCLLPAWKRLRQCVWSLPLFVCTRQGKEVAELAAVKKKASPVLSSSASSAPQEACLKFYSLLTTAIVMVPKGSHVGLQQKCSIQVQQYLRGQHLPGYELLRVKAPEGYSWKILSLSKVLWDRNPALMPTHNPALMPPHNPDPLPSLLTNVRGHRPDALNILSSLLNSLRQNLLRSQD